MKKHNKCPVCGSANIKSQVGISKFPLLKCNACTLRFAQNIPTDENLNIYYSQYAYGGESSLSDITIKRYKDVLKTLNRYRSKGRLIEIGCGRGEFLEVARKEGWEVFGTEYSEKAIEILKQKAIPVFKGDIAKINIEPKFDVVICIEVIEHVKNPQANINAISNLLRPGGALYLTTPNYKSISAKKLKENWRVFGYPEHLFYFTAKSLRRLLMLNDFEISKHKTTGISINEIRNRKQKYNRKECETKFEQQESFRQSIEDNQFKRLLKNTINRILSLCKKGDTHKIIAVVPKRSNK